MAKKFDEAAWQRFVKKLPPRVAEVAREYPANVCYRSIENDGHYWIWSYADPNEDDIVTVQITHGRDSYAPGIRVFGVQIGSLVKCDCGKWQPPTAEQCDGERRRVEAFHALQGRCAGCILPGLSFEHAAFCGRQSN